MKRVASIASLVGRRKPLRARCRLSTGFFHRTRFLHRSQFDDCIGSRNKFNFSANKLKLKFQ